ncbi:alpha/beta hydrolase [Bacillus cereus group sp. N6]|uniref:alpha/beta hydrolase n=1 Tax=Bacillus cereus group sp. N6 TaxID=2794583 RepID=UPI0018F77594|nr:alpha/beta hydrolase [Bacillus cereus group sp. N6]MBJ8112436.1 alpha/beta hydrolase [Bacillus cereus group sp. N6]
MNQTKINLTWRPRGYLQWLLTILSVIVCIFSIILAYYLFNPSNVDKIMSQLAMLSSIRPLFNPTNILVDTTLIIIVLLALSFWKRALIARTILIPILVLQIFLIVQPISSMKNYAKNENVPVSLSSHFFYKKNISTKPSVDVVYGKTKDGLELKLDVWPAKTKSDDVLTPAIVQIHGGGWVGGDKGQVIDWNQWMNDQGYTVFDVRYRMPPEANWKDEVGDVKSAIGWVVEHADTYKIDPKKINLMGQSAGGNLAMLAAYSMGDKHLPPTTNVPDVPINGVINLYGPSDMTKIYQNNPSPGYVQEVMKEYKGGTPSEYPERYKTLSPISHIQEKTPPTITFLGSGDRIVPVEQATILDEKLAKSGVEHEFYLFPKIDHGYDANPGSLSVQFAKEKVKAFLQKYN